MLTLSKNAVDLLTQARDQSSIPEDATLRIAAPSDGSGAGISLGFVDQPFGGDAVGESHGMPVCVAPEVAPQLDDATLDVVDEQGEPRLVLVPNESSDGSGG